MADWNPRANALFLQARELPAGERPAFLDRECGGDAGLRQAVDALLRADAQAGGFLDAPHPAADGTRSFADADPTADPDGTRSRRPDAIEAGGVVIAGKYKLLQQIGEGGMGTVWMADQTVPVKRRVAVKLIRAERGTSKTVLSRFEAERQAIALMDHPHIAKLLDAGTTDAGQPFFAMELVKGVPLTEYCDAHRLSIPDRLALFQQVCGAVQHAHQKGVIHRDLKPNNILVESHDGKPVPKVIDFGLAKATSGLQLTENTLFTGYGTVMGTPAYMAPEQAAFNAADIDTRADIYALGVILYELLTGTTPLTRDTIKKAALDEMLRLVREQEAPTPSSRLSSSEAKPTVAANRQTEPAKLGRFVKGELDWIVLKALSKDRDRRYETANGFAKDVERFLNHEPVQAGPPNASYRLKKFVRRHRVRVIAAGLVLLALLLGFAGTTFGLVRAEERRKEAEWAWAEEAKQRAEAETAKVSAQAAEVEANLQKNRALEQAALAREVKEFLQSVLRQASAAGQLSHLQVPEPDLKIRDALDRAAARIDGRFDAQPLVEAELRDTIGNAYLHLGDNRAAIRHLTRARDLLAAAGGDTARPRLGVGHDLALAYYQAGKYADAEKLLLPIREEVEARFGERDDLTLKALNGLNIVYQGQSRFADAEKLADRLVRLRRELKGDRDPETLTVRNNFAMLLAEQGRFREAEPILADVVRLRREVQGPDAPLLLEELSNLASVSGMLGKFKEAEADVKEALDGMRKVHPAGHTAMWMAQANLGGILLKTGRPAEAEPLLTTAAAGLRRSLGVEHRSTINTLSSLSAALTYQMKFAESAPVAKEAADAALRVLGDSSTVTATALNNLGMVYLELAEFDRALDALQQSVACLNRAVPKGHPMVWAVRKNLAICLDKLGRFEESEREDAAYLDHLTQTRGPDDQQTMMWTGIFAGVAEQRGRYETAMPLRKKLVEHYTKKAKGDRDFFLLGAREDLARAQIGLGQYDSAEAELRAVVGIREAMNQPIPNRPGPAPWEWYAYHAHSLLGEALLRQKKYADAEPLLVKGYEGLKEREKTLPPQPTPLIPKGLDRLIDLYTATNKPDEVKKYKDLRSEYPESKKEILPPPRPAK